IVRWKREIPPPTPTPTGCFDGGPQAGCPVSCGNCAFVHNVLIPGDCREPRKLSACEGPANDSRVELDDLTPLLACHRKHEIGSAEQIFVHLPCTFGPLFDRSHEPRDLPHCRRCPMAQGRTGAG